MNPWCTRSLPHFLRVAVREPRRKKIVRRYPVAAPNRGDRKGTGRARAGTIRSPIWVGGGRTFAAKPRDYSQKVNKKMYRAALRSICSELVRQDRLIITDSITMKAPKTKELAGKLKKLGLDNVLIVNEAFDEKVFLSARNLPDVGICDAAAIDPVVLMRFEKVLMTLPALKLIEERLA